MAAFNTGATDAPSATTYFGLNIPHTVNNYGAQLALRNNAFHFRTLEAGVFGNWIKLADVNWSNDNLIRNSTNTQIANFKINGIGTAGAFAAENAPSTGGFHLRNANGELRWVIRGELTETGTGNTGYDLVFVNRADDGSGITNAFYIKRSNGHVGIGTINPGAYKLAVEGMIGARKVKVTQQAWADFVFEPDYQLDPLPSLKNYIKQNKHLPGIPTAKEVADNGLDLGEINQKLLQKIEELTLHMIQLSEKNEALEKRLTVLESGKSL